VVTVTPNFALLEMSHPEVPSLVAAMLQEQAFYRLADEKREIILVACSKCDWRAAFARDELIAAHGADYPMPNLLNHLAAPGCSRLGSQWDRCGVHYVEPIEGAR
jgi:hypothetical protein